MRKSKQNILVIKHGAFGDLIQSDGIFRTIKNIYSSSNLILLTSSSYKNLMLASPYINNIIIDDRFRIWNLREILKLNNKLNRFNFTHVFDLQNSQRTLIYRKILLKKSLWITTNRKDHPISGLQGLIDMLHNYGIPLSKIAKPNINWMANEISFLLRKKKISKKYVVLIPGSSKNHKEKRWPFFKELAYKLLKEKIDVISIYGPDELELSKDFPGHKFESLNLMDVAGIIKKSIFVVGNDSGLSHIASCLKKPGIALFGPSTSGKKSELSRKPFHILETLDLKKLPVSKVFKIIKQSI
tara:strand:+ start:4038 stop:4934 length:897 start_codon:yes stop_codon:yes gene_type:complete